MVSWKLGDLVETRSGYGEALLELGRARKDVIVLDADLQRSNKTYAYGQEHPELFFDLGISEADMISTGAGMAAMGFTVFATSFAMFLPGRCYDQIRLQAAYAKSNLKLAGVSAGLTQGPDGASHQSLDDVALMRQLPGMTVIVPADAEEAYQAVICAAEANGPFYLRFGRYPTPIIFDKSYQFEIGRAIQLRNGSDVVLFATGIMVAKALQAADMLELEGVNASVVNVSTIKPIDQAGIIRMAQDKRLAISLEEHSILNGLGSAIAEILAETPGSPQLLRIGVRDSFGQSARAEELLDFYGLTPSKVAGQVLKRLSTRN